MLVQKFCQKSKFCVRSYQGYYCTTTRNVGDKTITLTQGKLPNHAVRHSLDCKRVLNITKEDTRASKQTIALRGIFPSAFRKRKLRNFLEIRLVKTRRDYTEIKMAKTNETTFCTVIDDAKCTYFMVPTAEFKKTAVYHMNGRAMLGDMMSFEDRIDIHECFGIAMNSPSDPEYADTFEKYIEIKDQQPLFQKYKQTQPFLVDPAQDAWTISLCSDT